MNEAKIDQVVPESKWKFDSSVAEAFDDMLRRSIPQYDVMRQACFDIGQSFVKEGTEIVDLGCSRGEALDPFVRKFGAYNRYFGVEISEPMLAAARERFSGYRDAGIIRIEPVDLRESYPPARASLTLSVLTAQFIPIEHRPKLFSNVFDHTVSGGAMIIVEKILGEGRKNDDLFVETYYSLKRENGYSQDQIERKRLSLEGVLVPVTARWNEDMLQWAGFTRIECFWRWMNFAGWLAVKS
jgi:tRNA (cmo5U34)-methyltransferase